VEALLQAQNGANRQLLGTSGTSSGGSPVGLVLSAGTLVGRSRELLATVNALETRSLAKTLSAPQIIATDSIPASITVGDEIPTISGTSISAGIGGASTSSIQTVGTGVNLNIIARVNASGIVTMVIDQDISAPTAASYGSIDSPTFSRRNVSTQVTVDDGDTIAIGGIITESVTSGVSGIPGLDRIPYVGGLFGSKTYSKNRTELILFLTPHVIYDTNGISDATEELKSRMKVMKKDIRAE
jgi:general secretion pathway protein D